MAKNKELELAINFIEKTDRNLFVTGKAGTGKTTFLHKIKNESLKRMVIVAPTGVAAINAKGVTIHSFFQMPFGPVIPDQISNSSNQQRKFSKTKIDIIKSLDLVVIDEISMVRADLLDGIDQVLRKYKNRNKVFGGAQVLMIGDLQQLSPVVKPDEWSLLREHYKTAYFFSSKAFQESNTIGIELKKIYRQDNEDFIKILNEIRNDTLSIKSTEILNSRYNPNFTPKKNEGYITLTTHNNRANAINLTEIEKLKNKSFFFKAEVVGKFNEKTYPNSQNLELKKGAQVMFIKNDSSPEKRYFNGKIGKITLIDDDTIYVKCKGDDYEIETKKEIWENIKYTIDEKSKEIKEEVIGSFSQIPLRLAWAITIHKSQGLTFEKAIIDAEASFAHGQTYVALSRCVSLDGVVLKTQITNNAIINDKTINSFNESVSENSPDDSILEASEKQYQLNLIADLFDFNSFLPFVIRAIDVYYKNKTSLHGDIINQLLQIKDIGIIPLLKIANGFKIQLEQLSENVDVIEKSTVIKQRFLKAIDYFKNQTLKNIKTPLENISYSTDNKAVEKDLYKLIFSLQDLLTIKLFCFEKLKDGFDVENYLKIRAKALLQNIDKKEKKKPVSSRDPILALSLRELRDRIHKKEKTPHFQIFTQQTLYKICDELPATAQDLLKIEGMGKVRVEKYGGRILDVISFYCKEQGIKQIKDKDTTKQVTLKLFKEGFTIREIAKKRDLKLTTIESHLVSFISSGDVDVREIIPLKRYQKIVKEIKKVSFKNLTELKEKVDTNFTFMELRMVLLSLEL